MRMTRYLLRVGRWRPGPWWIALAASVLFGIELGVRVFGNNDEARFPLLAQDIVARGDWLWPRLNGAAYYNKPPLLAWLIALLSWPAGHVTQLTAVIPSAAAAVATVVLVYQVATDLFGEDAGRFVALVAMTMQGLFFHAHLALPDVLMTCFITASLWAFVRMRQDRPGGWWIGFYGFVAAGFWAKGPAGLLPLAVAIVYAWTTRATRRWSLRLAAGLPLVAGAVGLWLLLGSLSDIRAVTDTVIIDQIGWYRPHAPSLGMLIAPVRNAFIALFPWVLLAPVAIVVAYRRRGRQPERESVRLVLVWLGAIAALVGFSSQQRLRYYVPLVPPMAVILGWWLSVAVTTHRRLRVPGDVRGPVDRGRAGAHRRLSLGARAAQRGGRLSGPGRAPQDPGGRGAPRGHVGRTGAAARLLSRPPGDGRRIGGRAAGHPGG
jgi:4-amino-4-deoxy-L-arabinose transferase-like glycosyltransferase